MTKTRYTIFLLFFTSFAYCQEYSFDTALVNKKKSFLIKTKAIGKDHLLLTFTSGTLENIIDTIESGGLAYIKYPDFNKDGNADILIDYYGNNSTYFLYLFDPMSNKFKEIDYYANFPNAIQLKTNPKYYYSYHRAGCADHNWVSNLFKIQDFKIIQLGHIDGQGCDSDVNENPQVIKIYKVLGNNEENSKLLAQLPYLKYIPNFGDKWSFIENYWNMNYTKFK